MFYRNERDAISGDTRSRWSRLNAAHHSKKYINIGQATRHVERCEKPTMSKYFVWRPLLQWEAAFELLQNVKKCALVCEQIMSLQ